MLAQLDMGTVAAIVAAAGAAIATTIGAVRKVNRDSLLLIQNVLSGEGAATKVEHIRGAQIRELFEVTRLQGEAVARLAATMEHQVKLQDERHRELSEQNRDVRHLVGRILEQTKTP